MLKVITVKCHTPVWDWTDEDFRHKQALTPQAATLPVGRLSKLHRRTDIPNPYRHKWLGGRRNTATLRNFGSNGNRTSKNINLLVTAYPNPTTDYLTLNISVILNFPVCRINY
ncbi:MAG: hypothetical protein R2757_12170 [Draconibacterium sp.]